ncbi:MAG: hypothetical protein ACREVI_08220 [Steroidobacteraceae bacterium]
MRSAILTILVACIAMAAPAQASDNATSKETGGTEESKLPPGFKEKKRGKVTLYCIKGKATGTRFQTESCYDKTQLHDYLLAQEQNNRDFDRARATCGTAAACSSD